MSLKPEELGDSRRALDQVKFSPATTVLLDAGDTETSCLHKKIVSRITDLEHEIRALKSRHNAVTPVCRLPQETLAEIFLTLAGDVQDARDWINVTFVCRHWRSVAVECATLWTNLPIVGPTFTDAIFPRTKNAPISLYLSLDEEMGTVGDYMPVIHKVISHISRVQSITLHLESNEYAINEAFSNCTDSALLLQDLVIIFRGNRGNGMSLSILKNLGTPSLEDVELEHCGVRWCDIPFSPTLRALTVITDLDEHRPTLSQFMATMKEIRLLDVITLTGILPPSNQPMALHPTSSSIVELSELTQMYLVDTATNISQFLRVTRLPQVHEMQLAFNEAVQDTTLVRRVLSGLRESWVGDDWAPMKHRVEELYIVGADYEWRPGGQQYRFTIDCPTPDGLNSALTLMVCFEDQFLKQMQLFHEFNKMLDFTSISFLHLDTLSTTSSDWKTIYSQLTKVEEIFIQGNAICLAGFMRTLIEDPAFSDSNPPPSPLFPSLRKVCLGRLNFTRFRFGGESMSTVLARILRKRADAQHPVLELKFVKVKGLTQRDYDELQQLAPETKVC